jgi:hypothetical protein
MLNQRGVIHYEDDSEQYFRKLFDTNLEGARTRAFSLLANGRQDENGCIVTDTTAPRKVIFAGKQHYAYRFIHCVLTETIASSDDVVRHRCANRQCINPDHLELGSQGDNKRDDWEHWANGIDFDLL